jgi:PAS domain S-box-containing protein
LRTVGRRGGFFRDIAESMSDIMWEIDSEWRYTFVAGKLEKYIGYTPDDLIGITPFDLMAEEESDAFLRVLKDASLELKPITDVEATVKSLDGKDSTFLVNAVPVIRDGVFAGYRGVVREISERKRIEKALRENERNLSIMMSNLPGMVYRCRFDERRTMEFVSDGIKKLTGYRPEDVTGNALIPYSGIINPDDRDMVRQVVTMAIENRISFELNYRIICSDKSE